MTPRRRDPVRLVLVDDSRPQRAGWAMVLGSQDDFEIVGQAGDGAQALAVLRRTPADVVLMDVQMPRVGGLVAAERIGRDDRVRALGPVPRIILVAELELDRYLPAAAQAGAYAVLYKDVEPAALFESVREAAAYRPE